MAGTPNASIYVLLIMLFASPFIQRLEPVSGTTILGYSNVSCLESEKKALLQFRQSLIDESNILSSWVGDDCCTWYGVGCSRVTGHVLKLNLSNPYESDCYSDYNSSHCLKGKINPCLQNLKRLNYLDLSLNNFLGIQIPEFFGSLKNLKYLDLSYSNIEGKVPRYLGTLSGLQFLDLSGNRFRGSIPIKVLKNLTQLTHLGLSNNMFNGSIPNEINNLTPLTHLDLSYNMFNGSIPNEINTLTQLTHLDLSNNMFDGSIPNEINTLTQLTHLDLSNNMFDGSIPNEINNLTQLTHLDLSANSLTGNLPPSLERLTSLKYLDMSFNQLSGAFPAWIGQLSDLETLDLGVNSMTGIISDNHLVNLTRLRDLGLSYNSDVILNFSSSWTPPFQLRWVGLSSCKAGPQFPQWLRNQRQIEYLLISNGSISDTIPDWFQNLYSRLTILDLSHNQIKGNWFERMTSYSHVQRLYLNDNQLTGKIILSNIPPNLKILDLSNNLLSGSVVANNDTTIQHSSLRDLSLSNNRLVGGFPTCICNITTLFFIRLSNNQISGQLPSCLGNLENLLMLDVTNNTLSGLIPPSLGSLQYLQSLHLHNNKFHGKLPSSFQHLTNLLTLDLAQNAFIGVIPPWIGQTLSKLRFLSLRSNKFHGAIPLQICQLSNLQLLNLAQNNMSGCIPSCFGNFTAMVWNHNPDDSFHIFFPNMSYRKEERILDSMKGTELEYSSSLTFPISLDLSNNFIVGEIPKELMGLLGLLSLNLAGNQITGRIPDNIGSLRQLLRLDLSRNELSGLIPQSLSNLSFLSQLNLSFNDLSGRIPTGYQLQTLDDPSIYMGNKDLCGFPSLNRCPGDQESPDHNHGKEGESEDDDDDDGLLWFYSGIGPGFSVGFLGFCGALHFNKSWRHAYFHFFEKVCNAVAVAIAGKTASLRHKFRKHGTKRGNEQLN